MKANYGTIYVSYAQLGDEEALATRVESVLETCNGYVLSPVDEEAKLILSRNQLGIMMRVQRILEKRKNES